MVIGKKVFFVEFGCWRPVIAKRFFISVPSAKFGRAAEPGVGPKTRLRWAEKKAAPRAKSGDLGAAQFDSAGVRSSCRRGVLVRV
jgi:hypothetical protein